MTQEIDFLDGNVSKCGIGLIIIGLGMSAYTYLFSIY